MIIRIVQMHFKPEATEEFEQLFAQNHTRIRSYPGCRHLSLVRDRQDPAIFFTISHWDSEEALEKYRKSPLFRSTWDKTRLLFEHRARAWTTSIHTSL
jgi:quinol monooxygenase YgiN